MTPFISWALTSFKIFALNYRSLRNAIFLDGTAELKLRSSAFPLSSVSIGPSAASRGPLAGLLAPNIASEGLLVAWRFSASLSSFWTSPSRNHFCKCAPFITIQVQLLHILCVSFTNTSPSDSSEAVTRGGVVNLPFL